MWCAPNRYVRNPLLIANRKFDLRLYVLVTSFDPLLIYFYDNGLARFCTAQYSTAKKHLKRRFMHLTNYSVNKNSKHFVQNRNANLESTAVTASASDLPTASAPTSAPTSTAASVPSSNAPQPSASSASASAADSSTSSSTSSTNTSSASTASSAGGTSEGGGVNRATGVPASKWTLHALRHHLRTELGVDDSALFARIHALIVKTLIAAEPVVVSQCHRLGLGRGQCFELFGFDVLIDSQLKPWLMEVNVSVGFRLCCGGALCCVVCF